MTPDPTQQRILDLDSGRHLVLAPPGCGKTQILAERIRLALANGVSAEDMLCLTFTNRAARGMRERINETVGVGESQNVFVGNVHRFCAHFLFENHIVPAQSAIIDDDTINSILARYMNEDETKVATSRSRKNAYAQIMFFAHLMYEIEHGVPKDLRIHPECVTKDDIRVMKAIAKIQDVPFDARLMLDIYEHYDFFHDLISQETFPASLHYFAEQMLEKMRYAHAFTAYKKLNNLLDFEDLLQLTYTALTATGDDAAQYKRYRWIQVDEVQDLNMLQLAIIHSLEDKAVASGDGVVLFLGDEQQAIFSFMGAKLSTIKTLKDYCGGSVHHLGTNHRSPKPLLELLNAYAVANLGCDASLLPKPSDETADKDNHWEYGGKIAKYESLSAECNGVAKRAREYVKKYADETTAIVVNSNADADTVSKALDGLGCAHFKISGTDIFSLREVKLLFAHLSVLSNDYNFLAWSRILEGLKVCETAASARKLVHQLRGVAMTPSEFLKGEKTCLQRFVDEYENRDIVVFDTETTGLDVFTDDIIQIAAERIRQGKTVDKFTVFIETERDIPTMLGDIPNPIIEERKHNKTHTHAEALTMFLDFVGDSPLLAHNASFDWHIMDYNIRRYLPEADWRESHAVCFDSLRLIRLLNPRLKAFKLKALLCELGLEGTNSHLADDDVNATVSLVNYCYAKAKEMLPHQQAFLSRKPVADQIGRLLRNYSEYYHHGIARLYDRNQSDDGVPALVDEMRWVYHQLEGVYWIKPVDKIDYIFRFLAKDVVDASAELSLKEQLDNHIMEINTFKEADLCGSETITDRLFVSTIHKAKGLEFDNVFVFDAVEGRIPNYYNENNPSMLAEDARKLYVALSRAKKRLYVCYSEQSTVPGMPKRKISRFIKSVIKYF